MTINRSLEAVVEDQVVWMQVDLDAIAHNMRELQKCVGPRVQIMAVVKDNAYGHGAVQVSRVALENGASHLAVARVVEGIELRQAGIAAPILVLGYAPASAASALVEHRITATVTTLKVAEAISTQVACQGAPALPVHVKVDTGMGRLGLLPHEALDFIRALSALPGLVVEGIFTHLSTADCADKSYAQQQYRAFTDVLRELREAGFSIPLAHVANSAALIYLPEMRLNMVRPGISLYGVQPSSDDTPVISLCPALSLHSRVARVRVLPAGSSISYGRTFITSHPTRVVLVPLGYGDGYHRLISNRGAVLIRGQRCPIIGRVCMDQLAVDASHVPDVRIDDPVVALGRQGDAEISVEQVAQWAQTISNEVMTALGPRVPRVYLQGANVVEVHSLLD
jgi:alanine racemase